MSHRFLFDEQCLFKLERRFYLGAQDCSVAVKVLQLCNGVIISVVYLCALSE
jgi:hypothetical protein